jgi:hypothetical protein
MGRGLWGTLILVCLTSVFVWADGGCDCESAGQPPCYATFRSNEIITFSLTLPVDYFLCQGVTETPVITGWWVETPEGVIVRDGGLAYPIGSWATFTWDLTNDAGGLVGPGFYRIVVTTTSAPAVTADVLIEPCRACSLWWSCWPCCPTLPCLCRPSHDCRIPYGWPYLELRSGGTRRCCGLTVRVYGSIGVGCAP